MKGYVRKVKRRKAEGTRLHRTAEESAGNRNRKKLLGKSTWYRGRNKDGGDTRENGTGYGTSRGSGQSKQCGTGMRTRSVIFVEQTPQGELAKQMREQLGKMEHIFGYRLRLVERTGRNLMSVFPQTSTWKGEKCGRLDCVTCNQVGEVMIGIGQHSDRSSERSGPPGRSDWSLFY